MKRVSGSLFLRLVACILAVVLFSITGAWAAPTTPEQARTVVGNWLGLEAQPLGSFLGQQIKEVQTFNYGDKPAYYVVYLNPAGLVLVPADDLVEPIIGFLPEGKYDPSPTNPLGALVSRDIPGRVLQARQVEAQALEAGSVLAPESPQAVAQRKWAWLANPTPGQEGAGSGLSSISEVRVAPFVQSRWSQTTVDDTTTGLACYNYFTPPYPAGSANNYPSGCVATAMGQLMRYWTHPNLGVGTGSYEITVDGGTIDANLRGGDGYGGSYNWASMVLDPSHSGTNDAQRQAIGNLLHDAGLSVNMSYTADMSGASNLGASALVDTFMYRNAIEGTDPHNPETNIPSTIRNTMVNPNLHARYPVLLGIYGSSGGHAIVCDGYGYNIQTMYHHLNLGWSGNDDAWYNLPLIYTTGYNFNGIGEVGYNIFVSGSGEIIAGRVTDGGGQPLSGATVTATGGYTATTDAHGIYALAKVPSGTTFTVRATKTGYNFTPQIVATGTSINNTITTGNVWGVDFASESILNRALDNYLLNFTTSGDADWFEETSNWYYGGSAAQSGGIAYGQSANLRTTVSGPGTLSFYWACSSTPWYNRLTLSLDSTAMDTISGGLGWAQKTLSIPAGMHTITWTYSKTPNSFGTMGDDCAWLDKMVYTPGTGKKVLDAIYLLLLMD